MSWNSIYKSIWPRSQRSTCLYLLVSNPCATKLGSLSILAHTVPSKPTACHDLLWWMPYEPWYSTLMHKVPSLCFIPWPWLPVQLLPSKQPGQTAGDYPMSEEELWPSAPLLNFVYFLRPAATWVLCVCLSLCVPKSQERNPSLKSMTLPLLPVSIKKLIHCSLPELNK